MSNPQTSHTERLARLIDDKLSCLLQLRDLGDRQQQLIEGGEMTQLLDLLATKQRFIGILQAIERDLTPFRGEDPQERVWPSPQDRSRCAERSARCNELLNELVGQEKANESLMQQRRHAVADRLHQVHAQSRASGAYRAHARGKPSNDQAARVVRETLASGAETTGRSTTLDLSSDIR